jgi:hypothetical protein
VFTKASHWTLSQPNPVRPIDPYLPKVHLNVTLPPTPRSSHWSLAFGPPNENLTKKNKIHKTIIPSSLSYEAENHPSEEHRLRFSEKRILKKISGARQRM